MVTDSISKNSVLLAIFAIITTGACVLTASLSHSRIETNKFNALKQQLAQVMPPDQHDNELLEDHIQFKRENQAEQKVYLAFNNHSPAGIVLPTTAPDGYGGAIDLLVGINDAGELTGVRVVPPHSETPGLGDAIELKKSDWILGFNGRSLENTPNPSWAVKKDGGEFDQFTGATITPRAVVKAVKKSLVFYSQSKDAIFLQHSLTHVLNLDEAKSAKADATNE